MYHDEDDDDDDVDDDDDDDDFFGCLVCFFFMCSIWFGWLQSFSIPFFQSQETFLWGFQKWGYCTPKSSIQKLIFPLHTIQLLGPPNLWNPPYLSRCILLYAWAYARPAHGLRDWAIGTGLPPLAVLGVNRRLVPRKISIETTKVHG